MHIIQCMLEMCIWLLLISNRDIFLAAEEYGNNNCVYKVQCNRCTYTNALTIQGTAYDAHEYK